MVSMVSSRSPPDPRVHFAKSPAPQDKTIVSMVSYDLLLEYHYALYSTPTCYSTPIWFSVGVHVQIPTFHLSRRNRRQASRGRWEEFFCRFFGGCSQNRSLMHCAQAEHRFTHASPPDPRVGTAIRASPGLRRIRASISQNRPPPKRKP